MICQNNGCQICLYGPSDYKFASNAFKTVYCIEQNVSSVKWRKNDWNKREAQMENKQMVCKKEKMQITNTVHRTKRQAM